MNYLLLFVLPFAAIFFVFTLGFRALLLLLLYNLLWSVKHYEARVLTTAPPQPSLLLLLRTRRSFSYSLFTDANFLLSLTEVTQMRAWTAWPLWLTPSLRLHKLQACNHLFLYSCPFLASSADGPWAVFLNFFNSNIWFSTYVNRNGSIAWLQKHVWLQQQIKTPLSRPSKD